MFPYISLFFMILSLWAALTPRFRSADVKKNWVVFYGNLAASGVNALSVLYWIFNWMTT